MLSKKDIIGINEAFHKGMIVNESSLDYAVKTIGRSKNWLRSVALLTRALLIDHVFEDGNKRTAAAVIIGYFDAFLIAYDPQLVNKAIVTIIKKNITDIHTIERLITDAIK